MTDLEALRERVIALEDVARATLDVTRKLIDQEVAAHLTRTELREMADKIERAAETFRNRP